jgi:hypothetical protein
MSLLTPSRTADVALISDDLYAILTETRTLGYVHKVGSVYVALCGSDLNHAVEVGQSLSWDQAVEMVRSL